MHLVACGEIPLSFAAPAQVSMQRPDRAGPVSVHSTPACGGSCVAPSTQLLTALCARAAQEATPAVVYPAQCLLGSDHVFSSARRVIASSMTSRPLLSVACSRAACCAAARLARWWLAAAAKARQAWLMLLTR